MLRLGYVRKALEDLLTLSLTSLVTEVFLKRFEEEVFTSGHPLLPHVVHSMMSYAFGTALIRPLRPSSVTLIPSTPPYAVYTLGGGQRINFLDLTFSISGADTSSVFMRRHLCRNLCTWHVFLLASLKAAAFCVWILNPSIHFSPPLG